MDEGEERMEMISLQKELRENSYPGRGIVIGRSEDSTKAVAAYFIMGRSENSRNRVFVEDGEGIRNPGVRSCKIDRSQPDYLCSGARAGEQDDCDQRRSDRYDL